MFFAMQVVVGPTGVGLKLLSASARDARGLSFGPDGAPLVHRPSIEG